MYNRTIILSTSFNVNLYQETEVSHQLGQGDLFEVGEFKLSSLKTYNVSKMYLSVILTAQHFISTVLTNKCSITSIMYFFRFVIP